MKSLNKNIMKTAQEDPKIRGNGLIHFLQNFMDNINNIIQDSSVIDENEDLDNEDETVKYFKDNMDGFKGVIKITKLEPSESKEQLCAMIDKLNKVRNATRLSSLRHIFSCIQKSMREDENNAENQITALKSIEFLLKDASNPKEYEELNKIKKSICAGTQQHLDASGYRLRELFASYMPNQNIKLAYTTLKTQFGEPYLLCPKGKFQIGYAVPMETSKCREQCIDSRVTVDGQVKCAYSEWLKYVADNQHAVNARLEVHKNPDKDIVIGTLAVSQRSIDPRPEETTLENRITDKFKDTEHNPTDNIETRLEKVDLYGHQKDDIQRPQEAFEKTAKKGVSPYEEGNYEQQIAKLTPHEDDVDDETIEEMLRDTTKEMSDEDLNEVAEIMLQEMRKKYPDKYDID